MELRDLKVESGVPLPRPHGRGLIDTMGPLVTSMKPGDSVFVATGSLEESQVARCKIGNAVRMAAWRDRISAGWSVRVVDGGVRFWRTR